MQYIYLRINGTDLSKDAITTSLELQPRFFYKKGESITTKLGEKITHTEDCWQNEKSLGINKKFESDIVEYMKKLIDKKALIDKYKEIYNVQIGVMIYASNYQYTFIISQKLNKLFYQLGADFFITIALL